jgi:hypothetical protein
MNCVEFGFDRSSGFGFAKGQFWPVSIDRSTLPYRAASDLVKFAIPLAISTVLFV